MALMERDGSSVDDVAVFCNSSFRRAREAKRPIIGGWTKNYQVLRNRMGASARDQQLPNPRIPEIYPIVATMTAWQTDTRPTFEVTPAAIPNSDWWGQMAQLSQDLEQVLQAIWRQESYDAEIEKAMWDTNVYGVGFLKVTWDQSLHGGLGNPLMRRCDPFTIYPDPDASDFEDMNFIHEVKVMSAQELEKRFPGSVDKVRMEGWTESDQQPTQTRGTRPTRQRANPGALPTTSIAGQLGTPSGTPNKRWGQPGGTDRVDAEEENGFTCLYSWLRVPKRSGETTVDTWRLVVTVGGTVLLDEPATNLWNHGQHPFVRLVPHDMGEMYGFSLVDMLTPAQESINRLLASIEQNIWLTGNPVTVATVRSGISRTQMTNKPGARLDVTSNPEDVKWMQPPQANPQQTTSLIDFYIGEMDRISGLSAIVRGLTPTGRNAQGVLDSLQEAAFVRIRMSLRNLERGLTRAGNLVASLITEFYDTPRVVPILGPDGQSLTKALAAQHFYLPGPDGKIPLQFALSIEGGSMLPTSKQARAAEAQTLFALGAIDEEALLEAMDWPGRSATVSRVRDMKALQGTLGQPPGARAAAGRTI